MPTTTPTQAATVHQPKPFEKWLATQPAPLRTYEGRHRGQPAAEVTREVAPAPAG